MPKEHVAKDLLLAFARGNLSVEARRSIIRHLLLCSGECRHLLRKVAASAEASEGPDSRLPRDLVTPEMLAAERTDAVHLWHGTLEKLDSGHRLFLVRDNPRYHTWGVQELLLDQSRALISDDPLQSLDLCHLSLEVVHRLSLDRYRRADVADLRGTTLASISNGKRLIGDLDGAVEAMDQALESLEWGTGDPLEEANVLSIYGSLLTDLGRIEEAMQVLGAGARDAREVGDTQLQAKLVLQQASSIGWYDPARGLVLTRKAQKLLVPGRSPNLDQVARYQLIFLLCELGEVRQARSLFDSWRVSFRSQPCPAFWESRILRLEAALARQEGRLDLCESFLHDLLDHYAERGMHHDLALTTLDLAELLTVSRRFCEAQGLLDNILPLFRLWRVPSDVLRAWLMIEEGVKGRTLEAVSFREASRLIRRSWYRT